MTLYELYKKAAAIVASGESDYSCLAINRASEDLEFNREARKIYIDLFSPTESQSPPSETDLMHREDDLLTAFCGVRTKTEERELRVLALLFMAQVSK